MLPMATVVDRTLALAESPRHAAWAPLRQIAVLPRSRIDQPQPW